MSGKFIKETTHVTTDFNSKDYKDLNDSYEAAINYLSETGAASATVTMVLRIKNLQASEVEVVSPKPRPRSRAGKAARKKY